MNHLWKSLLIIAFLVAFCIAVIKLWKTFLKEKLYRYQMGRWLIKGICVCMLTVVFFVTLTVLLDYCYPFERNVKLELVTIATPDNEIKEIGPLDDNSDNINWYGVYGDIFPLGASSAFHPDFIDQYIEPDLDRYSYIISYGYAVESLSYNVFEDVGGTYGCGVHKGHIVFSKDFNPWGIYIYRIPRLRIDN